MACGRLAVNVKKQSLFAFFDEVTGDICYLVMNWEGNKSARLIDSKDIVVGSS